MQSFIMKISFHSNANKANFHMKRYALSLAFIMRFTATRKRPIVVTLLDMILFHHPSYLCSFIMLYNFTTPYPVHSFLISSNIASQYF